MMMRQKNTIQMFCEKHLENIGDMFKMLYKNEQLADVTLYCKEGSIKAHKVVLAAKSPYFHRMFLENKSDRPIVFLHGISIEDLKNLIDLIYRGVTNVPRENIETMYDIADELQIKGVLQGVPSGEEATPDSQTDIGSNHNVRDTNGRGQNDDVNVEAANSQPQFESHKETINFQDINNERSNTDIRILETPPLMPGGPEEEEEPESLLIESHAEPEIPADVMASQLGPPPPKKARGRPRKHKDPICETSHLPMNLLNEEPTIETTVAVKKPRGRPRKYPKVEAPAEGNEAGSVTNVNSDPPVLTKPDAEQTPVSKEAPVLESMAVQEQPLVTVKRKRGRPRIRPVQPPCLVKKKRGRPRLIKAPQQADGPVHSQNANVKTENYDITNMPFGDLEYLTQPIRECIQSRQVKDNSITHEVVIEPYVEIKTERLDKDDELDPTPDIIDPTSDVPDAPSDKATTTTVDTKCHTLEKQKATESASESTLEEVSVVSVSSSIAEPKNPVMKIGECSISIANGQA